jgi:DNA polymerase-3 subunit delta'
MKIPTPQENVQLIGYASLKEEMLQLLAHQRFPHGILLAGPKGTGKATFAYHLARYLLKGGEGEFTIPSSHSVFRHVQAGAHPDFLAVTQDINDKEEVSKEIPTEKARAVVKFFQQKPMLGKWRVALIDSIDELNHKGANSLLKILEEPPAYCLIILITHNIEKILPTIRSRTQLFMCDTLSTDQVSSILNQLALGIPPEEQTFIARICDGRVGYGLDVLKLGGQAFYDAMLDLFRALAQGDFRPLIPFLTRFLLKNSLLDKEQAWQLGTRVLQEWIATRLFKVITNDSRWPHPPEETIARSFFQTRSFQAFAQSWFEGNELLHLGSTFNLDKQQAFVCFFSRLTGLIKTPLL